MSTYTYTNAYTRAQAVVDQVSTLFREAGINGTSADKVCRGVQERWLVAVGLYLVRDGLRVYEVEARINWSAHSDLAELEFASDLPGWEDNGSPEAIVLGRRFAGVAAKKGLSPRYWVRFNSEILADPARHGELCPQVGVIFEGRVETWSKEPTTRSLPLQDLREIGTSERSAF
ncbi:MAG TPA: hypothetical protein VK501_15975 [Baekduia sp.]|uniref:hypothetical protein n=1 Tax=Baekduia sp. TaxID=2600305 RepID=UPI002D04ECF0|nr:hypothetical protein [Baekduia sp.]HMJ35407.1 hypothetical protein [Baekduia sp.]